jgi:SAM-dependent methyltransferase
MYRPVTRVRRSSADRRADAEDHDPTRVAGVTAASMPTAKRRWLDAQWEFVRPNLPPAPASVIDLGCGPFGGFVPALREAGYEACGVDEEAPAEPGYYQVEFERFTPSEPADAVIASTSLHHTDDPDVVLDHVRAALRPNGTLVVVEWDWPRFDERTARWCFARMDETAEPGWLQKHRDRWRESGQAWASYLGSWATEEGLHPGDVLIAALTRQFDTVHLASGPYIFADLDGVSLEDESAAIDRGELNATGIQFVGKRR